MRRKRLFAWAEWLVAAVLTWLVLEATAFVLLSSGSFAKNADRAGERTTEVAAVQDRRDAPFLFRDDVAAREIVHPYVGYVLGWNDERAREGLAAYGFSPYAGTFAPGDSGQIDVAVFGGSVAELFVRFGGAEVLAKDLAQSSVPEFRGKRFTVSAFALGGYKQPQQLMTLSYFLGLGRKFDLIVNIDGFNEIVIPNVENLPAGEPPFFPRGWSLRVQELPDRERRALVGKIAYTRERRSRVRRAFSESFLHRSWCATALWTLADGMLGARIRESQMALLGSGAGERSKSVGAPKTQFGSEEELLRELATLWMTSSLQMSRIAGANGARYFHVLQPNQYVPGSKSLTAEEKALPDAQDHPYRVWAGKGYPRLVETGKELVRQGVRFHDMTMVFRDVNETIYVDCCHFKENGNEILGHAIARAILGDLAG